MAGNLSGLWENIKTLAGTAWQAISDTIGSIVSGIATFLFSIWTNKIRSVLHFSVPDEGPLTDYESWMPDFMAGLARGIEESKGLTLAR